MVKTIRIKFHFSLFIIFGNSDNLHFSLIMPLIFSLFLSFSFFFSFLHFPQAKTFTTSNKLLQSCVAFLHTSSFEFYLSFSEGNYFVPLIVLNYDLIQRDSERKKKKRRNSILKNILPDQSLMVGLRYVVTLSTHSIRGMSR